MASSPTFTKTSLPLFFFFFVSFSYGIRTNPFSTTNALNKRFSPAERLIRSLNLFPNIPVNIRDQGLESEALFVPGSIVEKKFSLFGENGPSIQDLGHHAGYYSLPTKPARMFYFFFETRSVNKDAPVVIWLTGGPGCASELALFYENGPFHISNNLSLVWNDYGWDKVSNIIYVDQPIGTGFSYTNNETNIPHDEAGVSNDLYGFLQAFFKAHPELVKNDFYITGESYAGHYVPALASRVHQGNKQKQGIILNLKGFAIGNGLTDPAIQYPAYTDYALDNKLITKADYDTINKMIPGCEDAIKACATGSEEVCSNAKGVCNGIFNGILNIAGDINYYDIRKKCVGSLCYDFSKMVDFLNQDKVKEALGVGDVDFVSCSNEVYYDMSGDWMKNLEIGIPALLEDGIKVLVYAGEEDLICNWLGNSRWVKAMQWSGQKEFNAAPITKFVVNGVEKGSLQTHGPLAFLKVHEAGHLVPMDQPEAALLMLQTWLEGKLTITTQTDVTSHI